LDKPGANRIALDVANHAVDRGPLRGAGVEAILPEVACRARQSVPNLSESAVNILHGLGHGVIVLRYGNEVNVVRHQAKSEDAQGVELGVFPEQVEIEETQGIAFEDVLAAVAALGEVVREAGRDHAGETGHAVEEVGGGRRNL